MIATMKRLKAIFRDILYRLLVPAPILRYRLLYPDSQDPYQATPGAAGCDLYARTMTDDPSKPYIEYSTGLAFIIPEGYGLFLLPRSSISDRGMSMANSVGLLDSDYKGEARLRYYRATGQARPYNPGERIGQAVLLPVSARLRRVTEDARNSQRDPRGFGTTGT